MERILIAVDGSEPADRALNVAYKIAAASRAECLIVTVTTTPKGHEAEVLAYVEHSTTEEIGESWARAVVEEAASCTKPVGTGAVNTKVLFGDPAAKILSEALDWQADLIAIGRRGRGRLEGLLLGSVSQKLAALSPVPVLIVP